MMAKPALKEVPAADVPPTINADEMRGKLLELFSQLQITEARCRDIAALADFTRAYTNCILDRDRRQTRDAAYVEEEDALRFVHRTLRLLAGETFTPNDSALELARECVALTGAEPPEYDALGDR
jgi:hypothetical protein